MTDKEYLTEAFEEAFYGVRNGLGGPFGAVVVRHGIIIGTGHNSVTSANDPTAHAEIVAIRNACATTNNFLLDGAVIYSTCEPCPMCLSAIYWARIKTVYYCLTRNDAERIGFSDNHIYNELGISLNNASINLIQINIPAADKLFAEWADKKDKIEY
ncbi:nucleoside deaminase [Ignavibacteria bacterium]|jgi:tRNA(Arg) A34 adenosine deaminase TadA|nr:nucleoside deaminase [Bacteroidota bacterium]MCZ2131759.1 nucleoside deaminase [Bacteroidota bacterium]